jgi:broad specificity phosphatase PhoE
VTLCSRRGGAALVTALVIGTTFVSSSMAGAKPNRSGYDVLFVRHAEANPPSGPLSDLGLTQAAALATLLHDDPVDTVDTSMLTRAFQTGAAVATDHGLALVADARINEVTFDLTGVAPADINAVVGARLSQWLNGEQRDNGFGAESYDEVQARWSSWWTGFVAEHRKDKDEAVVVAHGALLLLMLPATCSNPIDPTFALTHGLANTSIVKARLYPNGKLVCTDWAGTPIPGAPAAPSR